MAVTERVLRAATDAACCLCGRRDRMIHFSDGPYQIVECAHCRLVYTTPQGVPEALLREVYGEQYWSSSSPKDHGYADYRAERANYRKTFALRARAVQRYLPPAGRLLDVGCAAGYFLAVMRDQYGWQVEGIEPSAPIAKFGRSESRVPINVGTLEDVSPSERFDLISFWDVIEHVPDPAATLTAARKRLNADGRIILETQNIASLFARVMGRKWHHFKYAEHLWHFAPDTMRLLLSKAGLEPVAITSRGAGKYITLSFIQERAGKVHPALSLLASPLKLIGNLPLYVNLHDEMIVVAKSRR